MARHRKHLVHIPRWDEEPDFTLTYTEYDERLVDALIESRFLDERKSVGGFTDARRNGKVA